MGSCWRYNPNRFCLRHPYRRFGTCKTHCIRTGSCFNWSFRNNTYCVMIMHPHGVSHQVVVIPPRRMLPTVVFFHFTCGSNLEVYKVENRDRYSVFKPGQIGMKQRHQYRSSKIGHVQSSSLKSSRSKSSRSVFYLAARPEQTFTPGFALPAGWRHQ